MYEEVERRIKQLQRKSWKWVKHAPHGRMEMCAIADTCADVFSYNRAPLSNGTIEAMNKWFHRYSDHRWENIVEFNDSPHGAQSVEDVIVVFEKFRAELS